MLEFSLGFIKNGRLFAIGPKDFSFHNILEWALYTDMYVAYVTNMPAYMYETHVWGTNVKH